MRYIDLSHTFKIPMPVWPGDPTPEIKQIAELEKNGYLDHELTTAMHVGTHIDAPAHMIEHGEWLDEITLERFAGRGVLIDARGKTQITRALLEGADIQKEDIVLVLTGFGAKYREKEYYEKFPEMTEDFADALAERDVKIVGVDAPSPDREPFPIHKIFLGNDILILENLTHLEELIAALRCLPGVGPKTAQRMAYQLLSDKGKLKAEALSLALQQAINAVGQCKRCRQFTEHTHHYSLYEVIRLCRSAPSPWNRRN